MRPRPGYVILIQEGATTGAYTADKLLPGDFASATAGITDITNNSDRQPLYGVGREAGELNNFAATHLTNKCYDRLVVAGTGKWAAIEVLRLPYGPRPHDTNKRVWTDYFFVGAVLRVE